MKNNLSFGLRFPTLRIVQKWVVKTCHRIKKESAVVFQVEMVSIELGPRSGIFPSQRLDDPELVNGDTGSLDKETLVY